MRRRCQNGCGQRGCCEATGDPAGFLSDSCLLFYFYSLFYSSGLFTAGRESLSAEEKEVLLWLFRPPLQAEPLSENPNLTESSEEKLVEIGPRCCFCTFSSGSLKL